MVFGYVIRHGETEGNVKGISQGLVNFSLTENGRLQARNLVERLSCLGIKKIISSSLGRAQETANIINNSLAVRVQIDDLIREISYGLYDGRSDEELVKGNPGYDSLAYQFLGGESPNNVISRISNFFENFEGNYGNEPFLLVSHSGVIKAMMVMANELGSMEFYVKKIPHNSIGKIEVEKGKLVSFKFI
ncbi:hypothetical protein AUJ84_03500 [Candidatus Pacearchaeota archaeon CG1_02_32_132]|nr:MAG: hypothetical protein AUJ84_03500 [Candidatus Pacearchaeota archaeon CG1_02_32_132]